MGLFKSIFKPIVRAVKPIVQQLGGVALPIAATTFPPAAPILLAAHSFATSSKLTGQTMGQPPPSAGPISPGGGMSAWDTILQAGKAALPYVPGIIQGLTQRQGPTVMPGGSPVSGFGTFGGFGLPVAAPGGMAGRGMGRMRSVNRSASTYCRRHPGWCTQVGGLGAVANMVAGGQLPLTRSSRGRGISSRELRAFRKVHRVLKRIKIKTR